MGEGDPPHVSSVATSPGGDGVRQKDNGNGKSLKGNKRKENRSQGSVATSKNSQAKDQGKKDPQNQHVCDICQERFLSQFKFFEHLKSHYEVESGQEQDVKSVKASNSTSSKQGPSKLPLSTLKKKSIRKATHKKAVSKLKIKEEPDSDLIDPKTPPILGLISPILEEIQGQNLLEHESKDPTFLLKDEHILFDVEHEDDEPVYEEDELETERMYLDSNICPSCDQICDTRENLEQHIRQSHPEIDEIVLPKPSKSKKTAQTRGKSSKGESSLKCGQCHRVFGHRNSLVYHLRSHTGERPYKCDVCGKSFFATSALKVHERVHSGSKPYTCKECGRQFRQWGDLKYHETSLHSNVKAYQCEYCGKDFARNYSLTVHRRIHTGERNYRCEFCVKTFRAASYLQNHRRIHTGEKPHVCTQCGKGFRAHSDLKRHLKSHNKTVQIDIDSLEVIQGGTEASLCQVVSITSESNVILPPHSTILPLKANFLTTSSSSTATILSKEAEDRVVEQICVPLQALTEPHGLVTSSPGNETTFTVALAGCTDSSSARDILASSMVSEGITLYQDTSQNLDIFGAEGSRGNAVVLFPLGQQFLQE